MTKFKKFLSRLADIFDGFLAYVLTIVGILASNYLPLLKTGGAITFDLAWQRLALSAIVALLIIGKQEQITGDDKERSKAGRRRNFGPRMINALAQGLAWAQIMNVAM